MLRSTQLCSVWHVPIISWIAKRGFGLVLVSVEVFNLVMVENLSPHFKYDIIGSFFLFWIEELIPIINMVVAVFSFKFDVCVSFNSFLSFGCCNSSQFHFRTWDKNILYTVFNHLKKSIIISLWFCRLLPIFGRMFVSMYLCMYVFWWLWPYR